MTARTLYIKLYIKKAVFQNPFSQKRPFFAPNKSLSKIFAPSPPKQNLPHPLGLCVIYVAKKQGLDKGPPGVTLHSILRSAKTTSAPLPPNSFAGPTYMLNFRSAYFWPLLWQNFYTSSTPAMNLITHDSHQLTRTLTSWDTLSLWRERLRDCLGSASPSVPPSWYGEIPESLHLNKITADHPSIFGGKSWKAITNYVLNRPKWRQPKTTTSGGLSSLTVISANLWSNEQANMIII